MTTDPMSAILQRGLTNFHFEEATNYLEERCKVKRCAHVARFPEADPAHQILSAREPREWRRPMGRPCASCLQQVVQHFKDMGMGQASAWGMARRRPL